MRSHTNYMLVAHARVSLVYVLLAGWAISAA